MKIEDKIQIVRDAGVGCGAPVCECAARFAATLTEEQCTMLQGIAMSRILMGAMFSDEFVPASDVDRRSPQMHGLLELFALFAATEAAFGDGPADMRRRQSGG